MEWKYDKRGEYWEAESEDYFFALGGNKFDKSDTEVSLNIFKKEENEIGLLCKRFLSYENFNSIDEGKAAAEKIISGKMKIEDVEKKISADCKSLGEDICSESKDPWDAC
jgi:hypothetical protein